MGNITLQMRVTEWVWTLLTRRMRKLGFGVPWMQAVVENPY